MFNTRHLWYIYSHDDNVGMTGSKDQAFKMIEGLAKRKWSSVVDEVTKDKITLGAYEARLEPLR